MTRRWFAIASLYALVGVACPAAEPLAIAFEPEAGRLRITAGGQPLALYVYRDPLIRRPYFTDLRAPGGMRVTRSHPPSADDPGDHPTMHPGLWLAFGDLSGSDFWRNKGQVEHLGFEENPRGEAGVGTFAVANRYLSADGKTVVAREVARFTIHASQDRHLLIWRSEFQEGEIPLTFGDQEEMGLGIRLATPLAPKQGKGGRLVNAEGQLGEGQIRGKRSAWCSGQGRIDGKPVAVTIMTDPANFRPSWWHARDYGLIVANPFGRAALTGGEPSQVKPPPGKPFSLGFGVSITSAEPDPSADFQSYLNVLGRN